MRDIEVYETRTGRIYVDRTRRLEFLSVGDYGAANNIKANFLGFRREICGVEHRDVSLEDKWVITISTQKGCPMKCKFCDCPEYGFYGNASLGDLIHQVSTAIIAERARNLNLLGTKRLNLHFARMGEPTFNDKVLSFTRRDLRGLVAGLIRADAVHPVISTMLPKNNSRLEGFLAEWCEIKNGVYGGGAGLQLSINTTDDRARDDQFDNCTVSLSAAAKLADSLPTPVGRKYTLNFAVTKDTILDAAKLTDMFDKGKFIVKITPIHQTTAAVRHGFDVTTEYADFDVYRKFEQPLLAKGWDVIVFIPSVEEDEDRITCGNALLASPRMPWEGRWQGGDTERTKGVCNGTDD